MEKKTTKKKTQLDENKIREAKKKVNDLLQGTGLEDPVDDVFVPPTHSSVDFAEQNIFATKDSGSEWLSEQVAALTKQVEQYEKLINQLKSDNMILMNNGGSNVANINESEKNKIIELFKYFEGIYTGKNKMHQAFDTAKFSNPGHGTGILDLFLLTFPFLQDIREYKHRG